jgi:hypothetical protein
MEIKIIEHRAPLSILPIHLLPLSLSLTNPQKHPTRYKHRPTVGDESRPTSTHEYTVVRTPNHERKEKETREKEIREKGTKETENQRETRKDSKKKGRKIYFPEDQEPPNGSGDLPQTRTHDPRPPPNAEFVRRSRRSQQKQKKEE